MLKTRQKNALVHIEAFNLTAREIIQSKKCEKKLDELSRIITALQEVKTPEVWNLEDNDVAAVILNSTQLITQLDTKLPVLWNLVDLLTLVAGLSDGSSFQERFQVLSVLAGLLHQCMENKTGNTRKLLKIIQLLAQDFKVLSIESYLITLAQDLEVLILGEDHKDQLLAATILSTLLRKNILMVKIVMTSCSKAAILALRPPETDQVSLVLESIEFRLNQFNLNAPAAKPSVIAKILSRLAANLDIAFKNESHTMIRFFTGYLEDLTESDPKTVSALKQVDPTDALSKVLDAASFTKSRPELWHWYFTFLNTLLVNTHSSDTLSVFNNVLKIVLKRLEVKPYTETSAAIQVLITCIKSLSMEEMTVADKSNLKLQVEQILPCLSSILLTVPCASKKEVTTSLVCLQLLAVLQSIEPVSQTDLNNHLVPDKIFSCLVKNMEAYSALATDRHTKLSAELCLHFLIVCNLYAGYSSAWASQQATVTSNQDFMAHLAMGVKHNRFDKIEMKKALEMLAMYPDIMLSTTDNQIPSNETSKEKQNDIDLIVQEPLYTYLEPCTSEKLDKCMEDLREATARLSTDDTDDDSRSRILPQVLHLQQFIGQAEQRQIQEHHILLHKKELQASLVASDARIRSSNLTILHLNQQINHLNTMLATIAGEYGVAQEEIRVTRAQHNTISSAARDQINALQHNLAATEKELEQEKERFVEAEEVKEKMKKDLIKMKEEMQSLIQDRESQEAHLKETKAALAKRDDKLKRTIKQLDQTQTRLDESTAKNEKLEKSSKSLETLVKNQEEKIAKQEKQLENYLKECEDLRRVRDAIFNLSKSTTAGSS